MGEKCMIKAISETRYLFRSDWTEWLELMHRRCTELNRFPTEIGNNEFTANNCHAEGAIPCTDFRPSQ